MITCLGDCIARTLVASGVIPAEDAELYSYGFFLLLSNGLYLTITIALGTVFGILLHSVLFYLFFSLLRGYAGGIHARTEWGCMFSTTATLVLSVGVIRHMTQKGYKVAALALLLAGCTVVFLLSPLDTPEKPLPVGDRQRYRRISRCVATAYAGLGIVSIVAKWDIIYPVALAAALSGVLLLLGAAQMHRSIPK